VKFDEVPQKPDAPDTQTVQKEIGFSMQELMKMELAGLPDKGDISDWVTIRRNAGKDDRAIVAELLALVEKTPLWTPSQAQQETKGADTVKKKPTRITELPADVLMTMTFEKRVALISGVLSRGITFLSGAPKSGKSLLALLWALLLSSAGYKVVYFALEDDWDRLKDRIIKLGMSVSANLTIVLTLPRLNEGGEIAIIDRVRRNKEAGTPVDLIILDVWAVVKPRTKSNAGMYELDYASLEPLKKIEYEFGTNFLCLHHTRKMKSVDIHEAISGSQGIMGSVDSSLILVKPREAYTGSLHITSRDLEERTLALELDSETLRWDMLGEKEYVVIPAEQQKVLDVLKASPDPMALKIIAGRVSKTPDNTRGHLDSLIKRGRVFSPSRGLYTITTTAVCSSTWSNYINVPSEPSEGSVTAVTSEPSDTTEAEPKEPKVPVHLRPSEEIPCKPACSKDVATTEGTEGSEVHSEQIGISADMNRSLNRRDFGMKPAEVLPIGDKAANDQPVQPQVCKPPEPAPPVTLHQEVKPW
jgi:hypothetical protein